MRILREFPENFHTGPCTDAEHAGRCIESQSTLAHAPRFSRLRAHRPMHRVSEHAGRCIETQSPLAHAPRFSRLRAHRPCTTSWCLCTTWWCKGTSPCSDTQSPLAHAPRLRAHRPMHRDAEHAYWRIVTGA